MVAERLKGEVAKFDIVTADGKLIVAKDKRITARHIRDIQTEALDRVEVPSDTLLGRVLARAVVNTDTGEVVARANEEISEEVLAKLALTEAAEVDVLFTNDLDQGAYISQTLRVDDVQERLQARVAIYRMMRPGEPPTEDAVEQLFQRLFFSEDTYDLSRVGRMLPLRRTQLGTESNANH